MTQIKYGSQTRNLYLENTQYTPYIMFINSLFTKRSRTPPKATGSFEFVIHDWSYHMNRNDILRSPVFKIGETEADASQW